MVIRRATILDMGRISEVLGADFVANWLHTSRNNPRFQAVVAIHHKKVQGCSFGVLDDDNLIKLIKFSGPTIELVSKLMDKLVDYIQQAGFNPNGIITEGAPDQHEEYQKLGFGAVSVVYAKPLKEIQESVKEEEVVSSGTIR